MAFKSIGGLWLKESNGGGKFLSGSIEINGKKLFISVFKNDKAADNPAQPLYRINAAEDKLAEFVCSLGGGGARLTPSAGFKDLSGDDGILPF